MTAPAVWDMLLCFDSPTPSLIPRAAALPQCRLDQRVEYPARDGLDVAITCSPDVAQHHVWLDTVHQGQGFQQAIVGSWSQGGPQGRRRPVQHVATMTTAERFLLQPAETLERFVLEGQLERGAHVGFELTEQRKGPVEELAHPAQAVGRCRFEASHGRQGLSDHGTHKRAAAREIPIGGRAGHVRLCGHLWHRWNTATLNEHHRLREQATVRPGACSPRGWGQRAQPGRRWPGHKRLDKGRHGP